MPYIDSDRRVEINLTVPGAGVLNGPGELNYAITRLILNYLQINPDYSEYNEVAGVLACIQQELYRRAIAPYEDTKIEQNGDIQWGQSLI